MCSDRYAGLRPLSFSYTHRPPMHEPISNTVTSRPRWTRCLAAQRPAAPAPMTATRDLGLRPSPSIPTPLGLVMRGHATAVPYSLGVRDARTESSVTRTSEADHLDAATRLDEAASHHRSIPPLGESLGAAPYEVQQAAVTRRARRLGSRPVGYKVALTSPAAQAALGTSEPATGRLLAVDVLPGGATVDLDVMFARVLEAELVSRVREALPMGASAAHIAQGCDVAAGLECPDSRYADWFGGDYPILGLDDVIADNCLTGLVVVGSGGLAGADVDLPTVRAPLLVDDDEAASGSGAEVLGDPLRSMVWLSAHLAASGQALTAGTLVSAGTLTSPVVARPGTVRGVFSAGLGEASVRFT